MGLPQVLLGCHSERQAPLQDPRGFCGVERGPGRLGGLRALASAGSVSGGSVLRPDCDLHSWGQGLRRTSRLKAKVGWSCSRDSLSAHLELPQGFHVAALSRRAALDPQLGKARLLRLSASPSQMGGAEAGGEWGLGVRGFKRVLHPGPGPRRP